MPYRDDRNFRSRSPLNYDYTVWIGALVAFLIIAAIGVWAAFQGPTRTATAPEGLTGQAASKTGSTTVGAPAGTTLRDTTGQAVSPSGSTTTRAPNR
jgi:hypothetical protein